MIESACKAVNCARSRRHDKDSRALRRRLKEGVEIKSFSPEVAWTALRVSFDEVIAEQTGKDADFQPASGSLTAYVLRRALG